MLYQDSELIKIVQLLGGPIELGWQPVANKIDLRCQIAITVTTYPTCDRATNAWRTSTSPWLLCVLTPLKDIYWM